MPVNSELVSVCIPVYNGAQYIGDAVNSVRAQTYKNIEIVVQDNLSTDSTWKILREIASSDPRVRIEQNKTNIGMAPNWNKALSRANGRLIALLSADDYYAPDFISKCVSVLSNTKADIVTTNHYYIENGIRRKRKIFLPEKMYQRFSGILMIFNPFPVVFSVFRRDFYERMSVSGKLFSERFRLTCDYEFLVRVAVSESKLYYLSSPNTYYRVHGSNLSRQTLRMTRLAALSLLSHGRFLSEESPIAFRLTMLRFVLRILRNYIRLRVYDRKLARSVWGRFLHGF